ncbi:MAG: NTP transferase domain-containing protein [Pseudomonadota bacterium]
MTWQALVLAGERPEGDPLAATENAPAKAFVEIGGKPMISYVLDALAAVPAIGSVTVTISPSAPTLPSGLWERIEAARSGPSESVLRGLETLGTPLLVTTADHPMLSSATVEAFLQKAKASGADVIAGVARGEVAARAKGAPARTVIRFRDGGITGCNLFALMSPEARGVIAFWQRLEAMRKRPASLALAVGPLVAARFKAGILTLAEAEAAIARKTGVRVATVMLDDPLAAHDVDKPDHLAFARQVMSGKWQS